MRNGSNLSGGVSTQRSLYSGLAAVGEVVLMNRTAKVILGVCCLLGIYWIAQSRSVLDALALSLCVGGLVWILLDKRIADLKTRLAILESGETGLQESVEVLYRGETVFHESVEAQGKRIDSLHDSVDALYETVDKLSRRVEYHSEWRQSLHEMIGVEHRGQKTVFVEANDTKRWDRVITALHSRRTNGF